MQTERVIWHKQPILQFIDETTGRRLFSAGVKKCKVILKNIEAIKSFVESEEKKTDEVMSLL